MKQFIKVCLWVLFAAMLITGAVLILQYFNVAVLNPQGEIASKQRDLIVFTTLLGLLVVVPVFVLLGVISWRFREGNKKANYRPNWDSNKLLETIWWGIPCIIIFILGIVTWQTSHELDPYKKLTSTEKPIEVQVVALQWKWLFIYPEQGIASVNFMQFPEKTPVNFTITSDAPMNSLWIPSLGSQVYAMSGMSTKLHLIADKTGDHKGSSANISGEGFADMTFVARSSTKADFEAWVRSAKTAEDLTEASYNELAKPSTLKDSKAYSLKKQNLYDTIVMKYMAPHSDKKSDATTPNETMPSHNHDMTHMEGM